MFFSGGLEAMPYDPFSYLWGERPCQRIIVAVGGHGSGCVDLEM